MLEHVEVDPGLLEESRHVCHRFLIFAPIIAVDQRACLARSPARSPQRLGRAGIGGCEDDVHSRVGIRAPSRVDGQRACACPRPHPVTDELAAEQKRSASAALVGRPLALGHKGPVRDPDGREVEQGAELEREAGSARMVAASCVDEEYVRHVWQRANSGFQECALAEGEQARLVRRSRMTWHHCRNSAEGRCCPRRVACLAGAALPAGEADEDAADSRVRLESPCSRPERGKPRLLLDQLLARERPGKHRRILAPWTRW